MEMIRDEVNLQHIMENAARGVKGAGELSAEAIEANEGQFPPSSEEQLRRHATNDELANPLRSLCTSPST